MGHNFIINEGGLWFIKSRSLFYMEILNFHKTLTFFLAKIK